MDSNSKRPEDSRPRSSPNISRWFWVTIIILAAVSILLTLLAVLRNPEPASTPFPADSETVEAPDSVELAPTRLEQILNEANQAALEEATEVIDRLLDEAYVPVHAAIPAYTDFHYSLVGEYIELTAAAVGDLGGEIQRRLFSGFEARLENVTDTLDTRFETAYRRQIEELMAEELPGGSDSISLGPLTQSAIDNAKTRIAITAPMAGLAIVGGAASLKAASLIAKKVSAKVAAKVAAKSGAKWAAAMTGGGTGAVVCSWAGPGAGICAAGGAVIAWMAVDITVLKLDEIMNRQEFEADVGTFVDQHKADLKKTLANALAQKSNRVQEVTEREIADFTLESLTRRDVLEVCSIADGLVADYDFLRTHLSERNPDSIQDFLAALTPLEQQPALRPLAQEARKNLATMDARLALTNIKVRGNFPEGFRIGRDVSGRVSWAGETIKLDRVRASEFSGFVLRASPNIPLAGDPGDRIQLVIEQHLRMFTDRLFWGAIEFDVLGEIPDSETLEHRLVLTLPIAIDSGAESLRGVDGDPSSGHPVELELTLSGNELPEVAHDLNCP